MSGPFRRRAARVLCLDPSARVLLLHWRDPQDGRLIWEPPGGGLEEGETDLEAARRELFEETGITARLHDRWATEVERDFVWAGRRYVGPERFFALRLAASPAVHPVALTDSEAPTYLGHAWFRPDELGRLDGFLEPPHLLEVLTELVEGSADDENGGAAEVENLVGDASEDEAFEVGQATRSHHDD